MKPAVLYARVSSREQEKEGYSIPAQIRLLEEYAKRNGLEISNQNSVVQTHQESRQLHQIKACLKI